MILVCLEQQKCLTFLSQAGKAWDYYDLWQFPINKQQIFRLTPFDVTIVWKKHEHETALLAFDQCGLAYMSVPPFWRWKLFVLWASYKHELFIQVKYPGYPEKIEVMNAKIEPKWCENVDSSVVFQGFKPWRFVGWLFVSFGRRRPNDFPRVFFCYV